LYTNIEIYGAMYFVLIIIDAFNYSGLLEIQKCFVPKSSIYICNKNICSDCHEYCL